MIGLKGLALAVALLVGATSLAMAQAQGSGGPDGYQFYYTSVRGDFGGPGRREAASGPFIFACSWPLMVELAGHRPTDRSFVSRPGAP